MTEAPVAPAYLRWHGEFGPDPSAARLRGQARIARVSTPFGCSTAGHRERPAVRRWGVTRQALLLDVKEALVDEFVDAEGA